MNFPTIFDWLAYFDPLRGYPAAGILLVTGALIALFLEWRLSLLALIVQYLAASLLFFDLLSPQLALIKLFTGMFVCLILYWTARQLTYGRSNLHFGSLWPPVTAAKINAGPATLPRNLAERLIAVAIALVLIVILQWGVSLYLPGLPENYAYINLAILLLIGLGLAGVITSREPYPAGMSILTFLTGFELYFAALDQSTRTLALLAALNFIVALGVSYLTQRRAAARFAVLQDE